MKETGIQFGYHNHNFEFQTIEGKIPYFDIFLKELDKELDLFWAVKGGQDPLELFKKFKRILAENETAGMKYMFVEQDRTKDGQPFEAVQKSITNLTTKILV